MSEVVVNFFCNFAKTGNPNVPSTSSTVFQKENSNSDYSTYKEKGKQRSLIWEPYEVGSEYYLSITSKPKMKSHYRGHKMAVWLNLIPQLHQPGDKDVSMRHHHFHEREPHYYAGPVRAESFTKVPHLIHSISIIGSHIERDDATDCTPNVTTPDDMESRIGTNVFSPETEEVLHHLTSKQYYSYTAALGVTIGVGCLLLFLNVLIFAGIYYQRGKDKLRNDQNEDLSNLNASTDAFSYPQQRSLQDGSVQNKSSETIQKDRIKQFPLYTTVPNSMEIDVHFSFDKNSFRNNKKAVLLRTNNSISGSIKKRVQIQEISV